MSSRAKLITAVAVAVTAALVAVLVATLLVGRDEPAPQAAPKPDLPFVTEDMLIGADDVPEVAGTTWGTIVAPTQGGTAPVSPPECSVFLGQIDAAIKGLALRSGNGTALGVELAVPREGTRPELSTDRCADFSLDAVGTRSTVRLEPTAVADVPSGALSATLRTTAERDGGTRSWDVAVVIGYHRGVLVSAQYTPGPDGGAFDDDLAAQVPAIYRAQIDRLDAA